jgi:hypothetical protein
MATFRQAFAPELSILRKLATALAAPLFLLYGCVLTPAGPGFCLLSISKERALDILSYDLMNDRIPAAAGISRYPKRTLVEMCGSGKACVSAGGARSNSNEYMSVFIGFVLPPEFTSPSVKKTQTYTVDMSMDACGRYWVNYVADGSV